ncbi:hypothetical protein AMECASPLE_036193 [Ameca splendens]|uniref:Uncharacterized protein n=1 Tax=Ameca splendens TaxID=208324 RepID=A0ABV1A521_9TELE
MINMKAFPWWGPIEEHPAPAPEARWVFGSNLGSHSSHRVHPQFTPKEPQKPLSHHAEHLGREGSTSLQPIMMQLIECLKRHEGPDHRDHIHLCRYRRGGPQQSVRFRGGPVCRIHVDGERGGVQQTGEQLRTSVSNPLCWFRPDTVS